MALRLHPEVNASWMEDKIRMNKHIHVGVAVAIDTGLVVPVIKHTDHKSLTQIKVEIGALAGKAKIAVVSFTHGPGFCQPGA